MILPFEGNYNITLKDNYLLIEGYNGTLLIDKLFGEKKTYFLLDPIYCSSYKIYAVYEKKGTFVCFISDPIIGFHYNGENNAGMKICTGDLVYKNPETLLEVKTISEQIINSFRIINTDSLGNIKIPEEYTILKTILTDTGIEMIERISRMSELGLIKPIL